MREIRYRGRTKLGEMWVMGYFVPHDKETYIFTENQIHRGIGLDGWLNCCQMYEVDPLTVGQFTGKLDKYGKKIFEGDIVKTKYGRLCVVCWHSSIGLACWDLDPVKTRENIRNTSAPNDYDLWVSNNLEVVGNIHDYPEMLK